MRRATRRDALRMIASGLVSAGSLSAFRPGSATAASGADWGYFGAAGPENWGSLDPAYRSCGTGHQQSPVDLRESTPASLDAVQIYWRPVTLDVVNNGHTIQVNAGQDSFMVLDGKRFTLLQFHFHHPSEHVVLGQPFPMEVHFVHQAEDGSLGVLGVFLVPGGASGAIQSVWDNVPTVGGRNRAGATVDAASLLPGDRSYFRYQGSLTTPPCSEIVNWVVFAQPVAIADAQIEAFGRLYPMNARPVQPRHRRFILGTF